MTGVILASAAASGLEEFAEVGPFLVGDRIGITFGALFRSEGGKEATVLATPEIGSTTRTAIPSSGKAPFGPCSPTFMALHTHALKLPDPFAVKNRKSVGLASLPVLDFGGWTWFDAGQDKVLKGRSGYG
jgi:hypothetical protein